MRDLTSRSVLFSLLLLGGRRHVAAFLPVPRSLRLPTPATLPAPASSTRIDGSSRRREALVSTASSLLSLLLFPQLSRGDTSGSSGSHVLADLPMIRLRLPGASVGREYVAVQLMVDGKGPFDFMVDTGLTTELITPHLQQSLGIAATKGGASTIQGLAAGGATVAQPLVPLRGAALCRGRAGDARSQADCAALLPLPELHAVITDFPQEHIDPAHDPVEGMLGMELLSRFDVDFDFPAGRIRFCRPGTAFKNASDKNKLVEIPAVVINETGLIGIRVTVQGGTQPVLGFLDCGSTFSCVNWAAAPYLGIPPRTDPSYQKMDKFIQAIGVDGRLLQLPLVERQLSFAGNPKLDPATKQPRGFEAPPAAFKPWRPVSLGVGDIPAFASILGDGVHPYAGPAALIGLDILSQRRVIFEAGTDPRSRARRVYVGVA